MASRPALPGKTVSIGRGGQPRSETGNFTWAVDVKVAGGGPAYYPLGVITRFYKTKNAAMEHAAAVNAGTAYKPGSDFYGRASEAIVVPALFVNDAQVNEGFSPWETPQGMQMMEDAYTDAQVPLPDWLVHLKNGSPVQGSVATTQLGAPTRGDAAASVGDRRQSLEPTSPADRDLLLESIAHINAYKRNGKAAPYQFLVLMWAISRARSGEARFTPFNEVKDELLAVLSPFRVAKTEPDPADPWYALRNTDWWELSPPLPATLDDVRRLNVLAGLRQPVYDLLSQDAAFAERAIATLIKRINSAPEQQYALVDFGLSSAATLSGDIKASPFHENVPVESSFTEQFIAEFRAMGATERMRREAALQRKYQQHLERQGHTVSRKRIVVDGQTLYSDLYDEDTDDLIEVKSLTDRVTMRLALGQILDYAFVVEPARLTVVTPTRPAEGIIRLYTKHEVRIVWPNARGEFEESDGSRANCGR